MRNFKAALFLALFILAPATASAAWHLYLVPIIGAGTDADPRRPNHLDGFSFSCIDYGFQPHMLCAADVDASTDAALAALSDVTKIPDNLDAQIGAGAVTTVQNALENRNMPAGWVTSALTYRTIIKTLWGFFAFLQRYSVISGNTAAVIAGAVTLETQFNQLSLKARQDMQATAASLGLSSAGLTGTSTIRQILKSIADQWGQRTFTLGGITI